MKGLAYNDNRLTTLNLISTPLADYELAVPSDKGTYWEYLYKDGLGRGHINLSVDKTVTLINNSQETTQLSSITTSTNSL